MSTNYLSLRSTVTYVSSGVQPSIGTVYTVGSNGNPEWTSTLVSPVQFSSISGSSLVTKSVGYSTLLGSTLTTGTLEASGLVSIGTRLQGSLDGSNNFWLSLQGSETEVNRVGIGIGGNPTTGTVSSLSFNAGGLNRMFIHSTGNVGIATTDPQALLDVHGRCYLGVSGNRYVELAADSSNTSYIDFHSQDSRATDYDTRIQSWGGTATTGQGSLDFYARNTLIKASTIGTSATATYSNYGLRISQVESVNDTVGQVIGQIGFEGAGRPVVSGFVRCLTDSFNGYDDAGGLAFGTSEGVNGAIERVRINESGFVGIGTSDPVSRFHLHGSMLVTNPTVYNTETAGWFNIGYWDASNYPTNGAKLKVRIMGCNGYDNSNLGKNGILSGGETTIYLCNLNNTGNGTTVNVDGVWKHEGGVVPFYRVKVVQNGSNRSQYYIYAYVGGYTQHTINAETTYGTIFTPSFTSVSDPGVNSSTVQELVLQSAGIGGYVGIGTTNPTYQLHVEGAASVFNTSNDIMGLVSPSYGNYLHIGSWNRAGSASKNIVLQQLGGNVGISTTEPSYKLDVNNPSDSTTSVTMALTNGYAFGWATGANIGSGLAFRGFWAGDAIHPIVDMCRIDGRKEQNANYGDSYLAFHTRYETDRNGGAGTLSEKMRISAIGNVGIGTTLPQNTLHIHNITADQSKAPDGDPKSGQIVITNSKTGISTYSMAFGVDQAYGIGYLNAAGNGDVQPICINTRGGNVGIGTITPESALHIYRSSTNPIIGLQNGANSIFGMQCVDNARMRFGTWSGSNTLNDYLVITTAGNVGIGTTNPSSSFHVYRTATANSTTTLNITNGVNSNTDHGSQLLFSNNHVLGGEIHLGSIACLRANNAADYSAYMQFSLGNTTGAANSYEVMRILPNGNVGIGTTSPQSLLQVAGTCIANTFSAPSGNYLNITNGAGSGQISLQANNILFSNANVGIRTASPSSLASLTLYSNLFITPQEFAIGGSRGTYYRIRIQMISLNVDSKFTITRGDVHTNGDWLGSMDLDVEFRSNNCGHGSQFLSYKYRQYSNNSVGNGFHKFVGRIVLDDEGCIPSGCYVYLNGNFNYFFTGSGCYLAAENTLGTGPTLTTVDEPFNTAGVYANCSYDSRQADITTVNQNVGIGTQTPNAPLHVHSQSSWSLLRVSTGSATYSAALLIDPAGTITSSNPSWFIGERANLHGSLAIWGYDGTNHFENAVTIDSNKNVGIGTTNPSALLHLMGNTRFGADTSISGSSQGSGYTYAGTRYDIILPYNTVTGWNGSVQQSYYGNDFAIQAGTIWANDYNNTFNPLIKGGTLYLYGGNGPIGSSTNNGAGTHFHRGGDVVISAGVCNLGGVTDSSYSQAGDIRFNWTPCWNWVQGSSQPVQTAMIISGATGNVGIGITNPSYKLHVVGDIYASANVIAMSDQRVKRDLQPLGQTLDRISSLNGYTYFRDGKDEREMGLIAQEVLTVFPEAVHYDKEQDRYGVNYGSMIAPLLESIKDLKMQVATLTHKVLLQEEQLATLINRPSS